MSPEQAAGRLDELGPATDIYALGATLYCLLTGRPPIDRREKPDFVQAIEAGDYPPPRKLWPQIAPALEAICLKAMRRDPCKRYATARDLATDIERWLADEPIGVYVEPFTARASRWMRKNPAKVATGITAALLLILATSTIAIVVGRYNQVVAKANEEIRQQKDAAETRRKEAETVTDLLLDSFQSKQGTAVFRLTTFDEVLDRAVASLKSHDELSSPVKRELWTAFGQSYVSIGAYPKAIESLEQAIRLSPNDLSQESLLMRMDLGNSHLFAKQHAEAIEVYEPLLQEMTAHLGPVAQQTHQLSMQLATAYRAVGREDDAIQLARTRYALYRKEVGDSDQRTLDALSNLAFELQTARQLDEAITTTKEGLRIAEQSHGKHGEYALYFLGNLVYLHLDAGRNDEARQFAEQIAAAKIVDHATYLASTSTGATLLFPNVTNQWQAIDQASAKLTSHRGLGGRALLALRAGRHKEARETARALLTIRQHAAIEHFIVALASHALGETDEARTHYLTGERDLAWLKEPAQHLYLYDRLAAEVLAREVQGLLK
jgi:tetratricopeptide (TPR) repeat protein